LDRTECDGQLDSIEEKEQDKMFKSLEEMMRFSETARQAAVKSIARLTVAASIAAIWIQGFFYAFLPAE
jgi:hypothetical protein